MENKGFGLYVQGVIVNRVKRTVGKDANRQEIVTYTVEVDNGSKIQVDEFQPNFANCPLVGEVVTLPVRVRPFKGRYDSLGLSYVIRKDDAIPRGEAF